MTENIQPDNSIISTINWKTCPINIKGMASPVCKQVRAGTATCQICGHAKCPICGRHNVTQLSRVTGYMSDISGWNEAKKQEFRDRKHYDIGGH